MIFIGLTLLLLFLNFIGLPPFITNIFMGLQTVMFFILSPIFIVIARLDTINFDKIHNPLFNNIARLRYNLVLLLPQEKPLDKHIQGGETVQLLIITNY